MKHFVTFRVENAGIVSNRHFYGPIASAAILPSFSVNL
jgi:hypothetical protein